MENYKEKINDVDIDACSESARQKILKALENQILGYYKTFVENDPEGFTEFIVKKGAIKIKEAKEEFETLGIILELYPE